MLCVSIGQILLILLFTYPTLSLLLGVLKGWKYLKSTPKEEKEREYVFHSQTTALTLAGFSIAALSLFISIRYENLEEIVSILLFFSISFSMLVLSSIFMKIRTMRVFSYIGDVLADTGLLAIASGFLVFFTETLPWSRDLAITYSIFIAVFLSFLFLNLYYFYEYWKSL